jgi:aspartate/methionine/tyrosine aminotransferase
MGDTGIGVYAIQQWLFDTAHGRYDIDLAESGVQFQRFGDVAAEPEWELDYSQDRGEPATRRQIGELYGLDDPDRVLVAHGAQESLYLLYRSLLRPGDHVITTVPGWQQSWEVPAHMGCQVTALDWRPGSPFDLDALAAAIGPHTRLLALNSPGNPSGQVLDDSDWTQIVEIAGRHGAWVVNDEEYVLDFHTSVTRRYERAVSVSGLSKVYGMPALRLGWAVSQRELIDRMVNYKRYTTVSNSLLCERIGTRVLADRDRHINRYRGLVDAGHKRLAEFSERHADMVELVPPRGTPFAWFHLRGPGSSLDLVERLLVEHRVLVMPAEVFGSERGLRVTYARPDTVLVEGLGRLGTLLDDLAMRG